MAGDPYSWHPDNARLEAAYWMPLIFDEDFADLTPEEKDQRMRDSHECERKRLAEERKG